MTEEAVSLQSIANMIDEAKQLPHGELRLLMTEEASRKADAFGNESLQFWTRLHLIDAATYSGHREKSVVAFAWCLSKFQAHPDRFADRERSFLWRFKFILGAAEELPQISLAEFDRLSQQMEELYTRCGYNVRPLSNLRMQFAISMGDLAWAEKEYAQREAHPRDELADCLACETDGWIDYADLHDDFEQMIVLGEPAIAGRVGCSRSPHKTYAYLLRALALLGRTAEADSHQQRGYRLIRREPSFLHEVGMHIGYLTHRENFAGALKLFERHLPWALESYQSYSQLVFYHCARHAVQQVLDRQPELKLQLPPACSLYAKSGKYSGESLQHWLEERIAALGEQFNARNGNDYATTGLAERFKY